MFKNKQLIHDTPTQWGDCYRTAISCLLELPPEEVPHFYEDGVHGDLDPKYNFAKMIPEWISNWLGERGIVRVSVTMIGDNIPMILHACALISGGMPYLLSGASPSGVSHVVIGQGDKIIWDPSPDNRGIVGPLRMGAYLLELLVKPIDTVEVDRDGHHETVKLNVEMFSDRPEELQ